MKNKLFILLLVVFFFLNFRVFPNAKKRDDKEKIITLLEKVEEKEKARVLNEFGRTNWFSKNIDLKYYGEQALLYAEKYHQYGEMVLALTTIGHGYRNEKQFNKANDYVNRALAIVEASALIKERSYPIGLLLEINGDQNNHVGILECFKEHLKISQSLGIKDEVALYTHLVAKSFWSLREIKLSLDWFKKAKELFELLGQTNNVIQMDSYIAVAYMRYGDMKVSKKIFDESLAFSLENGTPTLTARLYISLIEWYGRMQDYKGAQAAYQNAIKFSQLVKDNYNRNAWLGNSNSAMAFASKECGDLKSALFYLNEGEKVVYEDDEDTVNNKRLFAEERGKTLFDLNQYDVAKPVLSRCIKNAKDVKLMGLGEIEELAELYSKLGQIDYSLKMNRLALASLERSVELYDLYHSKILKHDYKELKKICKIISEIYKGFGEESKSKKWDKKEKLLISDTFNLLN